MVSGSTGSSIVLSSIIRCTFSHDGIGSSIFFSTCYFVFVVGKYIIVWLLFRVYLVVLWRG